MEKVKTENTKIPNEEQQKKPINWKVVGVLFFVLILLPAGSWYYLSKGFAFRKSLLTELETYNEPVHPEYSLTTSLGKPFYSNSLDDKVSIVGFLSSDKSNANLLYKMQTQIHKQFDDREEVRFLSFVSASNIQQMAESSRNYPITDTLQWKMLLGPEISLNNIANQSYHLALNNIPLDFLLILTKNNVIKGYYDIRDLQQIDTLLEHITIIMPRLPERDIIQKPQNEK